LAGIAYALGGSISMLGVAIFAAMIAFHDLVFSWLDGVDSEEAGCLIGLIPIVGTIGAAVVVYRIGSSTYDDPEALTRTGFLLAAQGIAMVATVSWFRFVKRLERLDEPKPWQSGWMGRYGTPLYIVNPAYAGVAVVIALLGVLSTLAGAGGGDAVATCFVAVVMVVWALGHFR
jgi:hypothetical protein